MAVERRDRLPFLTETSVGRKRRASPFCLPYRTSDNSICICYGRDKRQQSSYRKLWGEVRSIEIKT